VNLGYVLWVHRSFSTKSPIAQSSFPGWSNIAQ